MFRLLESMLDDWTKQDGMIRCMAYTINLAAQKILQSLKGEATVPKVVPVKADAGIGENDVSPSGVLRLVRKIISRIGASNILWEALEAECSVMKIEPRRLILDMRVRWNSTYAMLECLLYLRPALDRLMAFQKKLGPAGFRLTSED
ncbi:hypothetical protein DFP73DRAFT_598207 [Morchella snyderi]|nr:hypothetical protein DFP73DRAFT_598207 [Morchella snyderi]